LHDGVIIEYRSRAIKGGGESAISDINQQFKISQHRAPVMAARKKPAQK